MKRDTHDPRQQRRHFLKASAAMGVSTQPSPWPRGSRQAAQVPASEGEPTTKTGAKEQLVFFFFFFFFARLARLRIARHLWTLLRRDGRLLE